MNIIEILRVALTALGTNRLRALLTTLGIVIGVASVVTLMSLGDSLQAYIKGQFQGLGADVLQISAARFRGTSTGTQPLTTRRCRRLGEPGCRAPCSGCRMDIQRANHRPFRRK